MRDGTQFTPATSLRGRTALVYGAAGAIGRSVAGALADRGALVFLSGRTEATVTAAAAEIRARGGLAEAAVVDALDEAAVDAHTSRVAARTGRVDIAVNVVSHGDVHGVRLLDIALDDFLRPVTTAVTTNFITARAAARCMARQGSGVILTVTAPPAKLVGPLMGGTPPAEAAVETLSRSFAAEVGPLGIRVLGLRTEGLPETWPAEFHMHALDPSTVPAGTGAGQDRPDFEQHLTAQTMLRRLPTLAEVAEVAAFLVSDGAGAMTGTVTNMTCGSQPD